VHAIGNFFRKNGRSRKDVSIVVAMMVGIWSVALSGCASSLAQSRVDLFAMKAPAPIIVPPGSALAAAESAARQQPGCFAVGGKGSSMEPIYLDGTAVVVRVAGFDTLEAGAVVVYRNARGVAVAHMLVEQNSQGWLAWGVNNERMDQDLVTSDNLVGIITQAFAAKTGSPSRMMATRLARNGLAGVRGDSARLGL
jgi:signal peptidase I